MKINDMVKTFKEKSEYDVIDEKTFILPYFRKKLQEKADDMEEDTDVVKAVLDTLNLCQYGETSDSEDLSKISEDLKKRGLYEVRIEYFM